MVCGATANNDTASNAKFTNCYFNSNDENQYSVWVSGNNASFEGCTFEGWRGLKTHEAYGSEVETLTVDNCDFTLTKKPGLAIGDVNPETTITIKNSRFNTQAGDQGLFIYETDTDVTTFSLVLENNTIVAGSVETLADAVNKEGATVTVPAGEWKIPSKFANNVTLVCEEGAVFTGNSKLNINGATVIGATFSNPTGNAVDQTINGTFKNCLFTGRNALRYCYAGATCVFEDCVFDGAVYGVHFDGGKYPVSFKNCTLSGFNAFGAAITLLTFDNCRFEALGNSGYNGVNLWGKTVLNNCVFDFDGSVSTEWIGLNAAKSDIPVVFTGCTVTNGKSPLAYISNVVAGNKYTIDGVEYTRISSGLHSANDKVYASSTNALNTAIAENYTDVVLTAGTYEGHFDLTGKKDLTLSSTEEAVINGMLWVDNTTATIKGLTLTNPNGVQHPNPTNSQYYATVNSQHPLVGAYNYANVKFENCVFDIVSPTVYGFYGYAHDNPVFEGCTFNCNGIRPIANNGDSITVNGCTFNDQYHYSVRIFENAGERQTVVYTNNTVQGTNAKGEFEGVNISKKGNTAVVFADFSIEGNTADLKYRYHKNVTLDASCTGAELFEKEN